MRIHDNEALHKALSSHETVSALYVMNRSEFNRYGLKRNGFLLDVLKELAIELRRISVPLTILYCENSADCESALCEYYIDNGFKFLYFNRIHDKKTVRMDESIAHHLKPLGAEIFAFMDQCLFEPGAIVNKQGEPYKVFSAFKRAFTERLTLAKWSLQPLAHPNTARPRVTTPPGIDVPSDIAELAGTYDRQLFPPFELHAHTRLNEFIENRADDYKTHRDFPGIDGTSALSPYLALGVLSARQCMHAVLSSTSLKLDDENSGAATWLNELIWREFYRHIWWHFDWVQDSRPFKKDTENIQWRNSDIDFARWCNGNTGFPIIDAAMRSLNETGFMHNRLRMLTASFLTKNLLIDWRLGEKYFLSKLIDADLPSNNGGWQWSASTGTDAQPYFRVFNPVLQSTRYDADGYFIKRFCPELSKLPAKHIHDPSAFLSTVELERMGYPSAMCDLNITRKIAIASFAAT